jgi:hypothetical protein
MKIRQRVKKLLGVMGALVVIQGALVTDTFGRDMQARLGLGYNSEFGNAYANGYRIPAVSLKYGLTRDLAVEALAGFTTASPNNSVTAAKVFKNIFFEPNLNFYFTLGLGLMTANSQAGVALLTGFGVEFFIPGIESLGFCMETGVMYDNGSGSYAIRTLGTSFFDAGMHFYF